MPPHPKPKAYRSKKYLEYIRQQPCVICGHVDVQAHHVRKMGAGGTGIKNDDFFALPICKLHHREAHTYGHDTFFGRHGIDVYQELFKLVSGYLKANIN